VNILLAVDESRYSAEAIKAVAERPWPEQTIVHVLSVVEPLLPSPEIWFNPGAGASENALKYVRDQAGRLTARAADSLRAQGLSAEPLVREGDPRTEILEEAAEWPADLVVVGSHGMSDVARWLLGSVSQSVVSHAPCSVEVVRLRPNGAAAAQ
jgi:nucleotide-binding universal stress UspA family protein